MTTSRREVMRRLYPNEPWTGPLGGADLPGETPRESHEAAARLFERHPHFAIFPGDSVEIMECLPLPEP